MVGYFCRGTIYFKIQPVNIAPLFPVAEIKIGTVVYKQLLAESGFIIFIGIGPKVEPDEMKGIGRVIDIGEFFKTIQAVFFVVQDHVNGIIDLLLPILCAGDSRQGKDCKKNKNCFTQVC